jgi:hypothetical protein
VALVHIHTRTDCCGERYGNLRVNLTTQSSEQSECSIVDAGTVTESIHSGTIVRIHSGTIVADCGNVLGTSVGIFRNVDTPYVLTFSEISVTSVATVAAVATVATVAAVVPAAVAATPVELRVDRCLVQRDRMHRRHNPDRHHQRVRVVQHIQRD